MREELIDEIEKVLKEAKIYFVRGEGEPFKEEYVAGGDFIGYVTYDKLKVRWADCILRLSWRTTRKDLGVEEAVEVGRVITNALGKIESIDVEWRGTECHAIVVSEK